MRLMSKGEYFIIPKGTKFTGSGKLGLKNWFFVWFEALGLKFDQILCVRTKFFTDFEALKCKFPKTLWFQANLESWGTEKFWNEGLREWSGGCEKSVLRVAHTHIPFSGEYPTRMWYTVYWDNAWCMYLIMKIKHDRSLKEMEKDTPLFN